MEEFKNLNQNEEQVELQSTPAAEQPTMTEVVADIQENSVAEDVVGVETATEEAPLEEISVSQPEVNITNEDFGIEIQPPVIEAQQDEVKEMPIGPDTEQLANQGFNQAQSVAEEVRDDRPYIPPYNPINYTAVKPVEDKEPMSRGLLMFILLLVAIIALTGACAGGYYMGKFSSSDSLIGEDVTVGLAAKPTDGKEMTAAQVYEKVNPSVVGICIYNEAGKAANASGVIYSEDGYIITNDHVYSEIASPKFKIYTYDNKEYDAVYVAGDQVSDLAILKVKDANFTAAVFGDSEQIIFGENVVAVGRPGGASNASSVTKGIISATSRRVQTTSSYSARLIETDCPINPGSSGGALVNMYGQVVGITSSKLASADIDAVGYAIPTTTVKRIVEELIKNGKVLSRAKLGITYMAIDSVTAEISDYKYEGLYVDSVSEDSDLYQKLKKGDIITHINGIEVTSDVIVLDIIEKSKAGDTIKVTYVDEEGKSHTVEAVLKANIGESSYFTKEQSSTESKLPQLPNEEKEDEKESGGEFNFPFGE